MVVGLACARRRWRWRVIARAAAARHPRHEDRASALRTCKRSVFASFLLAAAFSALLGSLVSTCAEAYGIVAWTGTVRGAAFDPDAFPGITELGGSHVLALDVSNNVYVGGTARNGLNGQLLTIQDDCNGTVPWRAFAGGDQPGNGAASAVVADGNGNVYVAGVGGYGDLTRQVGFLTIKYDQNGAQAWRALDTEPNNAYADALASDSAGSVLVAGRVFVPAVDPSTYRIDYLTIKYDTTGSELWRARVSDASTGINTTNATSLLLDVAGNAYLTGATDASGQVGYLAVSYDATGNERWRAAPKASQASQD